MSKWRVVLGMSMEPSMKGLSRVRMEVPSRTDWRTTGSWTPAMVTGWPRLECSTLDLRRTPSPGP